MPSLRAAPVAHRLESVTGFERILPLWNSEQISQISGNVEPMFSQSMLDKSPAKVIILTLLSPEQILQHDLIKLTT